MLEARLQSLNYLSVVNQAVVSVPEANAVEHWRLFDTLLSIQGSWTSYEALPLARVDIEHFILPYCYDAHSSVPFSDASLEDWVTDFVNTRMGVEKLVFSCSRDKYFAVSTRGFSYDLIDAGVEHCGRHTHFVVFSASKEVWVTFYANFPFVTVSWASNYQKDGKQSLDYLTLPDFFNANYASAFSSSSKDSINFFWRTYAPRISGLRPIIERF